MAQLPPKAPTMAQKWPSFAYQTTPMPSSASQPTSWMDEFLDFSSARRSSHRRSASDPIAFVEAPFAEERRNSSGNNSLLPCSNSTGFERLDDDQLSSMFSDDVGADLQSMRSKSTPSYQNGLDNDGPKPTPPPEQQPISQPKNEPEVVEDHGGGCETEFAKPRITFSSDGATIVDPKRVKRILANRQSAQRSRVRKLHYISELERSVTTLQTEVSTLSPRVAFLDHQRLILNVDNSTLKQRIAVLAQDKIFKDAHQEALKKEIERLRKVYHEQTMKKGENTSTAISPPSPPPPVSFNGTDEE